MPRVRLSDTAYKDITGRDVDWDDHGPWLLTGYDHTPGVGRDITTTWEGPLGHPDVAGQLAGAYPGVQVWRIGTGPVDETYTDIGHAARRIAQLFRIPERSVRAILTIAATEELGMKYTHGEWEITGDDDAQGWRIRRIAG